MDLRDLAHAVRKGWWIIAIAVLLSLSLAFVITSNTTPMYATNTTYFVSTSARGVSDSYQGGLFSVQRVKSYADLLTSDRLARAVVERTGVGLSPDAVRARINAHAVPETVLLQATVIDENPNRSQQIAAALAAEFVRLVRILETPPDARLPTIKIEVVAGPLLDPVPVVPRPLRNYGLAVLLGLMTGVGCAALRETMDTSMRSTQALAMVTGGTVLGAIPFESVARSEPLVLKGRRGSIRAEAMRHIRTNLQFVDVDRPVRTIVVTSAVPDEGKSTTSCNLAIAFADAGRRVVLISADLRRPKIEHYLSLEGSVGLTNVLASQVAVEDVLQRWGDGGLWVLPSGFHPANPSELLGSRNMADLLGRLRVTFDVVIIDTPPLLPFTDAAVLASRADGAILVTRYGKTSRSKVAATAQRLHAVDARLLGSILNRVPAKESAGDYYYQYAYTKGGGAGSSAAPVHAQPDAHPDDLTAVAEALDGPIRR
jgi:capsular exopolysaccharide synthesis family protein